MCTRSIVAPKRKNNRRHYGGCRPKIRLCLSMAIGGALHTLRAALCAVCSRTAATARTLHAHCTLHAPDYTFHALSAMHCTLTAAVSRTTGPPTNQPQHSTWRPRCGSRYVAKISSAISLACTTVCCNLHSTVCGILPKSCGKAQQSSCHSAFVLNGYDSSNIYENTMI